jgi:hypothetical protein
MHNYRRKITNNLYADNRELFYYFSSSGFYFLVKNGNAHFLQKCLYRPWVVESGLMVVSYDNKGASPK